MRTGTGAMRWTRRSLMVALGVVALLITFLVLEAGARSHAATRAGSGASVASGSSASAASPAAPDTINWKPCKLGQCATLAVPLSYADPTGKQIQLALFRLPAKDPSNKLGTILVNPGGPGASGVQFARYSGLGFPDSLRARFDIVGWDPRGVGASDPIDCGAALAKNLALNQAPVTAAQRSALAAGDRAFGAACKAKMGAILGNVATVDTARDMDRIRAALGERTISYIGYSYGTYLGAVYANMFPTHVRAMVLDGVSDPGEPIAQALLTQARALDGAMKGFFTSCGHQRSCPFYSGGHPAAAFTALERKLSAHPLRVGSQQLGPTQFFLGVANPLYSGDLTTLAKILAATAKGNGGPLASSYDDYVGRQRNGAYSTEQSANTAINCLDGRGIDGVGQALSLQRQFVSAAPLFGRFVLFGSAGCGYWPEPPRPPQLPITAAGAPPILVIGSTGDPITPYADAVHLAHELRSGVLITATNKSHTSNFGLGGPCDSLGVPYLLTGTPPANGSRCVAQRSTK